MRPPKTILLVEPNDCTASIMAKRLWVWGYRVTTVYAYEDAIPKLREEQYDLVLLLPLFNHLTWPHLSQVAIQVAEVQRQRHRATRIHDVQNQLPAEYALGVDRIKGIEQANYQLRESLRIILTRKRGPKKRVPEIYLPESMRRVA
jgi:CheY-like chemotaxis protein